MPVSYNIFNTYSNSGILPVTLGTGTGPAGNYWNSGNDYNDPALGIGQATSGPSTTNLLPPLDVGPGGITQNTYGDGPGNGYNQPPPQSSHGVPFNWYGSTTFPLIGTDATGPSTTNWLPPLTTGPGGITQNTYGYGHGNDYNQPLPQSSNTPGPLGNTYFFGNDYNDPALGVGTDTSGPDTTNLDPPLNTGPDGITQNTYGYGNDYDDPNTPVGTDTEGPTTLPYNAPLNLGPGGITQNTFGLGNKYTLNNPDYIPPNLADTFTGISTNTDPITGKDLGIMAGIGLASMVGGGTIAAGLLNKNGKQTSPFRVLRKDQLRLDGEGIGDDFKADPTLQQLPYQDFRSRIDGVLMLDGTSAAIRSATGGGFDSQLGNFITAAGYAAASATIGGAYKLFNLESTYGFGKHGSRDNFSKYDFTARSNVATRWNVNKKRWMPAWLPGGGNLAGLNPAEAANEFLGDKVSVIDFGKRNLKQIYRWKPTTAFSETTLGSIIPTGNTRDLVKFYFTGPKLHASSTEKDDVLVFRAIISSMTDSFNASWSPVQYIGRGDPNYTYTGYSRSFDLNFTVYATDRDEMKPMYRKLNYLASYTAPEYSSETLALKAPWLRITVGDLLIHQPVILTSVYYTFVDAETTWETNIVKDPQMMQAPLKVEVSLQFNVITDYLPQKGGRLYTLASEFNKEGQPIQGNNDWLSDQENHVGNKDKSDTKTGGGFFKREKQPWADFRKKLKGTETVKDPIK